MPIIVARSVEVSNRLEQLGWTLEQLLEVVGAMVAARNSCTENDPPSAPGWMSWKEGTRRLREIGRTMGFVNDEKDQLPSLIDPYRGLKFVVGNTDDMTGLEHGSPQNRSKKGPATERAVMANQGSIFDFIEAPQVIPLSRSRRQPGMLVSWYLCVYAEGDDIRAEFSCPVAVEGGFFTDFHERIILLGPDGSGGALARRDVSDGGSEFDIPVSRK